MEIKNPTDWKFNAKKRRIRQLVNTTWLQILELYPDRSAAVHMVNILRSKGTVTGTTSSGDPKYRDHYFISDEEILKIMESYKEELDRDALEFIKEYE